MELNEAFKAVKQQMASELELHAKTQKELESDLTSTKHQLLEIQHQLSMTEKVRIAVIGLWPKALGMTWVVVIIV